MAEEYICVFKAVVLEVLEASHHNVTLWYPGVMSNQAHRRAPFPQSSHTYFGLGPANSIFEKLVFCPEQRTTSHLFKIPSLIITRNVSFWPLSHFPWFLLVFSCSTPSSLQANMLSFSLERFFSPRVFKIFFFSENAYWNEFASAIGWGYLLQED